MNFIVTGPKDGLKKALLLLSLLRTGLVPYRTSGSTVERNLELMSNDLKNQHARHRLTEIRNALEQPCSGPEILKL